MGLLDDIQTDAADTLGDLYATACAYYRSGSLAGSVRAVRTRPQLLAAIGPDGFVSESQRYEFAFSRADFPATWPPRSGDYIVAGGATYELAAPAGSGLWDEVGGNRQLIVLHTVCTGDAA